MLRHEDALFFLFYIMQADDVRTAQNTHSIGVNIDYEVLGQGNMLMVSATGTAVVVQNK